MWKTEKSEFATLTIIDWPLRGANIKKRKITKVSATIKLVNLVNY